MLLLALYAILKKRRPSRVLRTLPFALALVVLVVVAKARTARAQVVDASLAMGREMATALPTDDGKTTVLLNGERVIVGRLTEEASLHDVLDRLEKGCREGGGTFAHAWEDAAKARAIAGSLRHGILREERADEGIVVCIVSGSSSAPTMAEALDRFSKTHDLGAIGRVHYAYARAHGPRTDVMTVETGDSFAFDRLAPPEGTAPAGSETTLPLPEGAARILTAEIAEAPFAMRVYASPLAPDAAMAFYDRKLAELGFSAIEGDSDGRMYTRGGAQVIVAVKVGEDDRGSLVTLAEAKPN
jgi:hypothetical protein